MATRTINVDDPWHKTQSFRRISTQALERGRDRASDPRPEATGHFPCRDQTFSIWTERPPGRGGNPHL